MILAEKFATAGRRRQHASRVRSPDFASSHWGDYTILLRSVGGFDPELFLGLRGAQAAGLPISAARRNDLARKVRDGEPPSPAREPRALPRLRVRSPDSASSQWRITTIPAAFRSAA